MTEIVIVGAGPAGATLALLLVQRGISVRLVEAARSFRRVFRGEGLMPSGLEALSQMGLLPLLDQIPHRAVDGWEFVIDHRLLFRVSEPIGDGNCMLVSQPAFLEALIEQASQYSHFELVQGVAVQDLLWQAGRVVGVKLSDERVLSADLVIGTDGRNSVLRQRADLPLEQQSQSFNLLWFKLADSPAFESENRFYSILYGKQAFGLFRSSEGNLQVGWTLHPEDQSDWKDEKNWAERFAAASPPHLAEHFRTHADSIERPVLLSIVVGRCSRWALPGLLLLGDAVHPMSPIRAQGINMALRDVIVAANHLVPLLSQNAVPETIDTALPQIQAEREPEIIRIQQLQREEAAQAEILFANPILRWAVSRLAPLIRAQIRHKWLARQIQLRQGVTTVRLEV